MVFFTVSISAPSPTPQSAPASIPSVWPPPPGHTPGPAPLPPMPTNPTPLDAPPLLPVSWPGQGSQLQLFHWCHARLGGSEWGAKPGNTPQVAVVSTWQCGCRTPFYPPTGCSFIAARVQLSEGWLPPAAGKNSKAWRLLVPLCTLGSTAGSSKLKAFDRQSILLTRSNSITWNND